MLPLMCFGLGGFGVVHGPRVDVVEYGPQVVVSAGDVVQSLGVVETGLVVVTQGGRVEAEKANAIKRLKMKAVKFMELAMVQVFATAAPYTN